MLRASTTLGLLLCVFGGYAQPCFAGSAQDRRAARELADLGEEAYSKGDLKATVSFLERAYALDPAPILLYNLANTLAELGENEKAISFFRTYLLSLRDPRKIEDVRALIKEVERRLAPPERTDTSTVPQLEDSELEPIASPPRPPKASLTSGRTSLIDIEPTRPSSNAHLWIMGGLGTASAITGSILLSLASSRAQQANDEPIQRSAEAQANKARSFQTAGFVAISAGTATLIAAVIWLLAR